MQKYGLKRVSERKFIELLSSLYSHKSFRRIKSAIRLLGLGSKIVVPDYSPLAIEYYIKCYNYIGASNSGIVINFDDLADIQMIPTIRATDCLRDVIGNKISYTRQFSMIVHN